MDVGTWLQGLGLGQYEVIFRENEVEADVLPDLTEVDLEKIGLPLGPRKRILKAIAQLGTTSAAAAPAPPPPSAADSAERRQLTVMFSDLVGSTALSARLDPEDMRRVIRAYQDAVSGVVARYDGFVAKFMGDGVLAYFGFPRAHEDDAARAVHAGLEIAQVVAGLSTPAREKLAARIGVATGLVVVGDIVGQGAAQEQAVVGDTPNLAARLQGLADAGAVVVSAATRRLVGDGFRLKDLGRHAVKGLAEPVEAWAALGVAETESRFEAAHAARLTGFVGRAAEAADLIARQRRAWEGRGQIVLISGEAGIGKSRLAAWVAEQAADAPHTRLRYQCSPYHRDSALYPFAQQFERAAGLASQDSPDAKLDKLEKVLALATDRLGEVTPLIAAMLSIPTGNRYPPMNLSPAQQRRQTLFALLDQMEGLAKKQPILMLFEDAHWADATSLEVLDLAIERMRKLPVLLLITFRPEFEAPWRGLPDVADIALGRLEPRQAEALVAQVTGGRKLPAEVLAQIVAKTDGVPLFVEELTKNVLESGLLVEDGERYRLDGPLPPLAIPSTLQDSLMARLDRLAAVKEIAQIGAAIGREFSYALLQAVVGRDEATLRAALAQLEESELVFRAGEPPAARYTFKHALVQDTAYESLLKSRRQILHQRIAEALRDKFPEVVEAEPELIAEHYTRAGLTEPAIVHWGKAGDLALRRSAFKEAIAHLGKAIEMTEASAGEKEKADGKLKLQVALGNALISGQGYGAPETKAAFERARETADATESATEAFSVEYGLWAGAYLRGELSTMRNIAANFLRDVSARPHLPVVGVAHRVNGITHWSLGEFADARTHLEQALAIFDPDRDRELAFDYGHDPGVAAMAFLALTLWPMGEIGRARRLAEDMAARLSQIAHVGSIAYGHYTAAMFEIMSGKLQRAARHAKALIGLARDHDMELWKTFGVFLDGWLIFLTGDRESGLGEMRRGVAHLRQKNIVSFESLIIAVLAEAEVGAGAIETALTTIDNGSAGSDRTGRRWFDAELHRIRGEILIKQNPADPAPAEAAFRAAIAVAQQQKARSFELRAALSLARLYQSTNRPVEAHDVLGPALEGFASTPEFPEIAEAKGLFEKLAETQGVKAEAARRAQRLKLQTSYGQAVMWSKGYAAEETKAAFARVGELATEIGDAEALFDAYYGRWTRAFMRGEVGSARETAENFLREAERETRLTEMAVAHRVLGLTLLIQGDFAQARAHCEQALRIYDPERDREGKFRLGPDTRVAATTYLALAAWCLGDVGRARELLDEAAARAVESAHAPTLANTYHVQVMLEILHDDAEAALRAAETGMALSREHGLALFLVRGALASAWARAKLGDGDAGSTEFRLALAGFGGQGNKVYLPLYKGLLAEIEAEGGGAEAALAEMDGALALAGETGEHWSDAELHRIRGEILLKQTPVDPAAAEAAYLTAIAIAQSQKARSFELRAALALAKLYQSTGRPIQAHDVLRPALEGISPTPEFPEIADGKALFEALASDEAVKAEVARRAQRLKLQTSYAQAVMWGKGYAAEETRAAFARAGELATGIGDVETPLDSYNGKWIQHIFRGEFGLARETAESFLREAERAARPTEAAAAHRCLAVTCNFLGDFEQAQAHCRQTLRIFDPVRDREAKFRHGVDSAAVATSIMAHATWHLGDAGRARELMDDAVARAIESAHAPTCAVTYYNQAIFEILRDDADAARRTGEAIAAIGREHGLALYLVLGALPAAWARAKLGDRDSGLAEFRQALAEFAGQGNKFLLPMYRGRLAEIKAARGDAGAALAGIDGALALAGETGERWFDAGLHCIRGEILHKQNPADSAPAEAAFLTAIEVARAQKTRSFELRAALAVAKLYQSTGRPVEAHDVLGPALEGFAPTPEFPEIAEAKALFEALAGREEVRAASAAQNERLHLQVAYANALTADRGYAASETQAAFERAGELAGGGGIAGASAYFGMWGGSYVRGDLRAMRQQSEMFLQELAARPLAPEAAVAHRIRGATHWFAGEFDAARVQFLRALEIFDPDRDQEFAYRFGQDAGVATMIQLALTQWALGEVVEARRRVEEMSTRMEQVAHAGTTAYGIMLRAVFELIRRDPARAASDAGALARVAREHDMRQWKAFGEFFEAWAARLHAPVDRAGVKRLREAAASLREQKIELFAPLVTATLAEAEGDTGDGNAAIGALETALSETAVSGQRWFDAELHRVRGGILLQQTPADPAAAEAAFLTAFGIAHKQKARSFELRAALSLAKLYQSTTRDAEARDVLGLALPGFSPTPEFPEIAEAQALLAEWNDAASRQPR